MTAPTRRIVNADDIGYTRAVTDTIFDCHERGIITSSTLMVNMPGAEYAAERASSHPKLGIGLHINLTEGRPTAPADQISDLLDASGNLLNNARQIKNLWRNSAIFPQVHTEIRAQFQRSLDLGVVPTHSDSHHGIQKLPVVGRAVADVLNEFEVRRARTPFSRHRLVPGTRSLAGYRQWSRLVGSRLPVITVLVWNHWMLRRRGIELPSWKATRDMGVPRDSDPKNQLIETIRAIPRNKTSEILLHPGSRGPDDDPSDWHIQTWSEDTPICTDPDVIAEIERAGIELISFRDL